MRQDWWVIRKRPLFWLFCIIIFASENYFYLKIGSEIKSTDVALTLGILWGMYVMISYRNFKSPCYKFKYVVILFLFLSVLSSIRSQILYGQAFSLGFRMQRSMIVLFLLYFPVSKLLYIGKFSKEDIIKIFYIFGTIELMLYILQYFLGSSVSIVSISGVGNRFGSSRYYFENTLINMLLLICFNRFLNGEKRILNSAYIIAILFFDMVVGKMRLTSISLVIVMVLGTLISRQNMQRKILYIFIGFLACIFFLNTNIVQSALDALSFSQGTTLEVRELARDSYISQGLLSPILGRGIAHDSNLAASTAAGITKGFYLADNGIFGLFYTYGIGGWIWYFSGIIIGLFYAWKTLKNNNNYFYFMYFLYLLAVSQNELPITWSGRGIFCAILFALIDLIANRPESLSDWNDNVKHELSGIQKG